MNENDFYWMNFLSIVKFIPKFMRSYQLELLNVAKEKNVIVYLDTGSGKTLISIGLMQHHAHRNVSAKMIFLCPTNALVQQQFQAISQHLDNAVIISQLKQFPNYWDLRQI